MIVYCFTIRLIKMRISETYNKVHLVRKQLFHALPIQTVLNQGDA
jgi:hypothetical protein